jgi:hypothetical protein
MTLADERNLLSTRIAGVERYRRVLVPQNH